MACFLLPASAMSDREEPEANDEPRRIQRLSRSAVHGYEYPFRSVTRTIPITRVPRFLRTHCNDRFMQPSSDKPQTT